jgi:hypothetical protein
MVQEKSCSVCVEVQNGRSDVNADIEAYDRHLVSAAEGSGIYNTFSSPTYHFPI